MGKYKYRTNDNREIYVQEMRAPPTTAKYRQIRHRLKRVGTQIRMHMIRRGGRKQADADQRIQVQQTVAREDEWPWARI